MDYDSVAVFSVIMRANKLGRLGCRVTEITYLTPQHATEGTATFALNYDKGPTSAGESNE